MFQHVSRRGLATDGRRVLSEGPDVLRRDGSDGEQLSLVVGGLARADLRTRYHIPPAAVPMPYQRLHEVDAADGPDIVRCDRSNGDETPARDVRSSYDAPACPVVVLNELPRIAEVISVTHADGPDVRP